MPENTHLSEIPLSIYLQTNSQQALADAVGLRQSAISKMIKTKRQIFVIRLEGGHIELREEKTIATQKTA